jgi:hypothetical protein
MTNWIVYSPFSKHAFWNKISEQLNRTDDTVAAGVDNDLYYVSINETYPGTGKRGTYLLHWSRAESMFNLELSNTDELILKKPLNFQNPGEEFSRTVDTENLKKWLETYEWIGFGYIIANEGVNRYTAVERSVYYTRNDEGHLIILDQNETRSEVTNQAIQHWFLATKASADMYIMYCHPDCVIPTQYLEYQTDKYDNFYYTSIEEDFNYFDLVLKPTVTNATMVNDVIYSEKEFIEMRWSEGSHLLNNTTVNFTPVAPDEVTTDLKYELSENGIRIENRRGPFTVKYKVTGLIKPSMRVSEHGTIEKTYLVLGE